MTFMLSSGQCPASAPTIHLAAAADAVATNGVSADSMQYPIRVPGARGLVDTFSAHCHAAAAVR
jgi:hypothetical protein